MERIFKRVPTDRIFASKADGPPEKKTPPILSIKFPKKTTFLSDEAAVMFWFRWVGKDPAPELDPETAQSLYNKLQPIVASGNLQKAVERTLNLESFSAQKLIMENVISGKWMDRWVRLTKMQK
jgi:hypothetical protein